MASIIGAGTTAGTSLNLSGDTTGNLAFQTNGTTTAMTIDTSQNVGIGTSSPSVKLNVTDATSSVVRANQTNNGTDVRMVANASGAFVGSYAGTSLYLVSNSTTYGEIDTNGLFKFNSGYGSVAVAYGCRAWVSFNGTTSPGTIRGSGNVTSVTKNGTGNYNINLSNAMPDGNYSIFGWSSVNSGITNIPAASVTHAFSVAPSTTGYNMYTGDSRNGNYNDMPYVYSAIFR